ncbi:hypothetical protein VPH35_020385 [Triticum aestivum]
MGRREGRVRTARIPAVAPVGGSRPTLDGFPMCWWPPNFFCRVAAPHLSVCYPRKPAPPLRPSSANADEDATSSEPIFTTTCRYTHVLPCHPCTDLRRNPIESY